MIKVHIVTQENRTLYKSEFEEFLKRRHEYYAVANRWVPISDDGLELDPFDTEAATYFLGMLDGRVVTSARIMPTSVPNLVSTRFPDMCEAIGGCPDRWDWADWTRTFVLPEYRGVGSTGVLGQMFTAVMEYCLEEGITHIGGIIENRLLSRWLDMGWKVTPAGLPRELPNAGWCIVAYVEVSQEAYERGKAHASVNQSLLVRRGRWKPYVPDYLRYTVI